MFAVDTADYMLAICGNDALRELSSPGKSGSFFYLTQDDRFMIKTVKKSEVKVVFLFTVDVNMLIICTKLYRNFVMIGSVASYLNLCFSIDWTVGLVFD